MSGNLDEQIEESSQAEKKIASVEWVQGQKYKITNYEAKNYICTSSYEGEIYLKEILPESQYYLEILNQETEFREIVGGETEVELIN